MRGLCVNIDGYFQALIAEIRVITGNVKQVPHPYSHIHTHPHTSTHIIIEHHHMTNPSIQITSTDLVTPETKQVLLLALRAFVEKAQTLQTQETPATRIQLATQLRNLQNLLPQ